jgi:hypothetical protein
MTGVGRSIGAAISGNRPLEDFELAPLVAWAWLLLLVALVGRFHAAPARLAGRAVHRMDGTDLPRGGMVGLAAETPKDGP